jgi:hypothetical protein
MQHKVAEVVLYCSKKEKEDTMGIVGALVVLVLFIILLRALNKQ